MSIGKLLGSLISIVNFIIEGLLRRQVVGIVQTSVVYKLGRMPLLCRMEAQKISKHLIFSNSHGLI